MMYTTPHAFVQAEPYSWPHDKTLHPKTTALVIVDMQNDFCSKGGYADFQGMDIEPMRGIIPNIQDLLTYSRIAGFNIFHTREGHRSNLSTLSSREHFRSRNNPSGLGIGDPGPMGRLLIRGEHGHDITPELEPRPEEPIIDKPGRSAFQYTDFKLLLDNRGVKNLIICGVTTDVCVTSTMRDANDMGFDCLLVSDATAAGELDLHDASLRTVCTEGGIFGAITSTKSTVKAIEDLQNMEVWEV